jgi:hypothetical protein
VVVATEYWFCRGSPAYDRASAGEGEKRAVLWLVAAVLVIAAIFSFVRGQISWGAVLIGVGLLVGPGGVSIFT